MSSFRVGIIGSGVSSMYLVNSILRRMPSINIDIFESLKYPYGLLRNSVSPQSTEFKALISRFNQIIKSPEVNIFLGSTVDNAFLKHLESRYNAIVSAIGSGGARSFPNLHYDSQTTFNSEEFPPWYNGFGNLQLPNQRNPQVCIIGYGNVSLDVSSYFLTRSWDAKHLAYSCPAKEYLKTIDRANVTIIGRKSLSSSSFSLNELRTFSLKHKPALLNENVNDNHPKAKCVSNNSSSSSLVRFISNVESIEPDVQSKKLFLRGSSINYPINYDIIISCIGYKPNLDLENSRLKTGWALNGKGNIASSALSSTQLADKLYQMYIQDSQSISNLCDSKDWIPPLIDKHDWLFQNSCEEVLGCLRGADREIINNEEIEKYLFKTMKMWRDS